MSNRSFYHYRWLSALLLIFTVGFAAWAQQSAPTVRSDKNDYAPGETAQLSGSGFHANEAITLTVHHSDDTAPGGAGHDSWTVTTDADGSFSTSWSVDPDDSLGSTFTLTADCEHPGLDPAHLHAETTFTDSGLSALTVGAQSPSPINPGQRADYTITLDKANNVTGTQNGNTDVSVNLQVSGLPTGASAAFYEIGSSTAITSTTITSNSGKTVTLSITTRGPGDSGQKISAGTYTFTVTATNTLSSANTISKPGSLQVTADTTAPTTTATVTSGTQGTNGWYKSGVTVALSATDNTGGSGVKSISYSLTGAAPYTTVTGASAAVTVSQDGIKNLSYFADDNAGNTEVAKTLTVKVDTIAPVVSPANVVNTTWRNTDLSQSFTASDGSGSGLAVSTDASFTLTASAEGNPTVVSKTVTDVAGNSTTRTVSALIDKTAPTLVQGTASGTAGVEGWYRSDVTVGVTGSDSLSGLANAGDASFTLKASGEGAAVALETRTVSDKAGNSVATSAANFKIDKTKPEVTEGQPQGTAGSNGWYRSNVTISVTATDSLSGLADSTNDASFNLEATGEGVKIIAPRIIKDKAGNEAATAERTFDIDTIAPQISGSNIAEGWRNTPLSQNFTATDNGSGLVVADKSFTLTVSADSPDASTPTVDSKTVTDLAGNTSEPRTISALIDTVKPVIVQTGVSGTGGNNGWYTSQVTVSYTASDSLSGLASSGDASFSLSTSAQGAASPVAAKIIKDQAGNEATTEALTFKVDTVPPIVTAVPDRTANTKGWYNAPVAVTFTGSDATSGAKAIAPQTYSGPDSSAASITVLGEDEAGNKASKTFNFKYDASKPEIIVDGVSDGQWLPRATVRISANDLALDSVTATLNGQPVGPQFDLGANDEGDYVLVVTASDEAGNADTRTFGFTIDSTAPEIKFDPTAPSEGGKYNTDQVLKYWINDRDSQARFVYQLLSSLTKIGDDLDKAITSPHSVQPEGKHEVDLNAQDRAGNNSGKVSRTFWIDKTAPVTAAQKAGTLIGNSGWFQSNVLLTLMAADPDIRPASPDGTVNPLVQIAGSGVASLTYWATGANPISEFSTLGSAAPETAQIEIKTEGITEVHFRATDNVTNQEVTKYTTVLYDKTPPTLSLPTVTPVEATGPGGAVVNFTAPTASDNVPVEDFPKLTVSGAASGSTFPIGDTTINAKAKDAAGWETTGSFTITVQDTTPPTLGDVAAPSPVEATGPNGAVVSWTAPTAIDIVDGDIRDNVVSTANFNGSTVEVKPGQSVFPLGSTTVSYTVTDAHNNSATVKTFTITVKDSTPPEITNAPANITKEATGPGGADVTYSATATDRVDDSVAVIFTPPSGTKFPLGTTTVSYSAEDKSGNKTATNSFTVTVQDTTPPVIGNPPTVAPVEATGPGGAVVNFVPPTATDTVDPNVTVQSSHQPGSMFPLGTTTVTFTAKDAAGNQAATKSLTIQVVDKTAPVISNSPTDMSITATSASGAVVNFAATALDIVDGNIAVVFTPASGATFKLGTTTVTYSATDKAGNKSSGSFKVTVTYAWSGFLQPINLDGKSIFKLGSTVPVKFQLMGASSGVTNAAAKIFYAKISNGVAGEEVEAVTSTPASSGNDFRYDASGGQYIYNLGTKGSVWSEGTYQLRVDLGDGINDRTVIISLKK